MSKTLKKVLVTGASLLMFASVSSGINSINNTHAAKLSSFPPSATRTIKLTKTLKADKLYGSGYNQKRINHHTKFYRGEKATVDLAEAEGYGFDIRNRRHPTTNYIGYSLPIKDAKYFKIIKNHTKRTARHYTRKHHRRYIKRHARNLKRIRKYRSRRRK